MMRFLRKLFLLFFLIAGCGAAWLWHFTWQPLQFEDNPHTFVVKPGSNIHIISHQLVAENIVQEPWSFWIMARLSGKASDIKAGNYQLASGMTPYQIFEMMSNGDISQQGVTFIEGWTFSQMREELNHKEGIEHVSMALTDAQIMERVGAGEANPEGLFFPDTYYFTVGMSDTDILRRAYQAMQGKLQAAWDKRAEGLPYQAPYQALIMASIIEKETAKADERPLIAKVFLNRLKIGMRLQTDPTVIYGLGEKYDGNLHKQDLLTDTPYNTYTREGLPPTPIAMPGIAAIEAALNPAPDSKALYFVSKGDGSHAFSSSLEEHNRAVAHYQLGQRN
jgi:UPF0755 protein